MNSDDDFDGFGKGQEIDISDMFERDNVEYERKNAKNIRVRVIPERVLTEDEKEIERKKMEIMESEAKASREQFEKDLAEGKTNFGKIMLSDSLKRLLKGE